MPIKLKMAILFDSEPFFKENNIDLSKLTIDEFDGFCGLFYSIFTSFLNYDSSNVFQPSINSTSYNEVKDLNITEYNCNRIARRFLCKIENNENSYNDELQNCFIMQAAAQLIYNCIVVKDAAKRTNYISNACADETNKEKLYAIRNVVNALIDREALKFAFGKSMEEPKYLSILRDLRQDFINVFGYSCGDDF